jgi:hypothetical protein
LEPAILSIAVTEGCETRWHLVGPFFFLPSAATFVPCQKIIVSQVPNGQIIPVAATVRHEGAVMAAIRQADVSVGLHHSPVVKSRNHSIISQP